MNNTTLYSDSQGIALILGFQTALFVVSCLLMLSMKGCAMFLGVPLAGKSTYLSG
jgi:hypothetical protein